MFIKASIHKNQPSLATLFQHIFSFLLQGLWLLAEHLKKRRQQNPPVNISMKYFLVDRDPYKDFYYNPEQNWIVVKPSLQKQPTQKKKHLKKPPSNPAWASSRLQLSELILWSSCGALSRWVVFPPCFALENPSLATGKVDEVYEWSWFDLLPNLVGKAKPPNFDANFQGQMIKWMLFFHGRMATRRLLFLTSFFSFCGTKLWKTKKKLYSKLVGGFNPSEKY